MEENHYCNNCQKHISAANFVAHSAFCERNIKICKKCNEPVPISGEKEHLEEYHVTVPCDLCGILLEKWMLPKHQESCTKRLVTCKYCEGEFPLEEWPEHFEFCSSRTEKCRLCQKYVMLKDKEKHYEIHLCEKKINHVKIDNEQKQNLINEAICHSASPEQDIPEKVDEAKYSSLIPSDDIVGDKSVKNLKVPIGASACAPDITKEISKHYTTCYICDQTIPWIDFNTHVPSCAADSGKCSRCGEDVPNHEIKEHILKNCKLLLKEDSSISKADLKRDKINRNKSHVAEENIDDQDMQQCPYCKQLCSLDRIIKHVESCPENCYECPYCDKKIPHQDKVNHELSECSILKRQGHDLLYMHSSTAAVRSSPENYKCTSDISITSKNRITEEKSSIDKSNAGASRKSSLHDKKDFSSCKPCCPCRKKSCKMQEQSYTCQKGNCFYCFEEIDVSKEFDHLNTCKKFKRNSSPKPEQQTSHKGAISKHSSFADMVKPPMVKCKFCKNTFTSDMFSYHETACIYQPFTCEECSDSFPLKDLEDHRCKTKRGRKKQGKEEKVQEKTKSPFGSSVLRLFGKSEHNDEYDSNRFHPTYSTDTFGVDVHIPCEFCEKLILASELVVHQTGCAPDIVSLPRKHSDEDLESKKPFCSKEINVLQDNSIPKKEFFSSESKTDSLYSRSGAIKKRAESDVKPGEFLQSTYCIRTSEASKAQKTKVIDYSRNSSIHSLWNVSYPDTQINTRDSKTLPHTSFLDKGKESEISCDTQKDFEDKEIFYSDDEMTEMLEFINEGKTDAIEEDFHAKCEELHRKYSKETASHLTSHHNLNLQSQHEGLPEIEKLQLSEATSSFERKPMDIFSENENVTFEVNRLNHHHLSNTASENGAFTVETVDNQDLERMLRRMREEIVHSVRNNQNVKLQHSSHESHCEASSEDYLEKWTKWQNRNSSNDT